MLEREGERTHLELAVLFVGGRTGNVNSSAETKVVRGLRRGARRFGLVPARRKIGLVCRSKKQGNRKPTAINTYIPQYRGSPTALAGAVALGPRQSDSLLLLSLDMRQRILGREREVFARHSIARDRRGLVA